MKSSWKHAAVLVAVAMTTMGSTCISITDPLVVTLNVKDIKDTYDITPGTVNFNNPPRCIVRNPNDYLDAAYDVSGAHLVDASVQTVGAFSGSVIGGAITVNGTTLATYSGPWSAFNTPQSILTSSLLVRNAAGVTVLLDAIQNRQTLTICDGGQFSSAAPAGLQVVTSIFAQVDVTP